MATSLQSCGIGGWGGPKPGDPDMRNSTLRAVPAFGGIDVSWTFPNYLGHAVAHTQLWRNHSPNRDTAVPLATVMGDFFYDKVNTGTQYWYWIRFVSVNGTVGDWIGPATATARPLIADLIEQLTEQIDMGFLSQSLKNKLNEISLLNDKLLEEIFDREGGQTSLAQALLDAQAGIAEAHTFIATEHDSRVTAEAAIAQSIDIVAATLNSQFAAVIESKSVEIDEVTGITRAMWTAQVTVNGLIGGFGMINDGRTVEAGFDVDRFWVGRSSTQPPWLPNQTQAVGAIVYGENAEWQCRVDHISSETIRLPEYPSTINTYWVQINRNLMKPFIIEGGTVFINDAAINKLTFSKLRDESGSFVVENGKLRAQYIGVGTLSELSPNVGIATAGRLRNANDTASLDLNATGGQIIFRSGTYAYRGPLHGYHYDVEISANGAAYFGRGAVSGGQLKAAGTIDIGAAERPCILFVYQAPPGPAPAPVDNGGN